jgi:PAS domain-containing protein
MYGARELRGAMEERNGERGAGRCDRDERDALHDTLASVAERLGLRQGLQAMGLMLSEAVLRRLLPKIAALKLDELVNPRADAPYISIWEAGRKKSIRMVYINPAIERISGFSPAEVLSIGFHVFVTDDLITRYHTDGIGAVRREEIPIEQVFAERQQQSFEHHWERIYEILTRRGAAFVKDVAEIEQVDSWFISTGTLVDVTAEVREARGNLAAG